jgi:hypothetical protein
MGCASLAREGGLEGVREYTNALTCHRHGHGRRERVAQGPDRGAPFPLDVAQTGPRLRRVSSCPWATSSGRATGGGNALGARAPGQSACHLHSGPAALRESGGRDESAGKLSAREGTPHPSAWSIRRAAQPGHKRDRPSPSSVPAPRDPSRSNSYGPSWPLQPQVLDEDVGHQKDTARDAQLAV